MTREEMMMDAETTLREFWGNNSEVVIQACHKVHPFNGAYREFLDNCTACGGNWGGMLLTGIHELYPEVWNAIPDDMGVYAFPALVCVLTLCGVDTTK